MYCFNFFQLFKLAVYREKTNSASLVDVRLKPTTIHGWLDCSIKVPYIVELLSSTTDMSSRQLIASTGKRVLLPES